MLPYARDEASLDPPEAVPESPFLGKILGFEAKLESSDDRGVAAVAIWYALFISELHESKMSWTVYKIVFCQ